MCIPVNTPWDQSMPGKCINYEKFWLVIIGAELIDNIGILVLPVQEVLKLKLSTRRKIAITGVFLVGSFVVVTGIIRIVRYAKNDVTSNFIGDVLWVNIHTGTAIISASLPTLRPLFTQAWGLYMRGNGKWGTAHDVEKNNRPTISRNNIAQISTTIKGMGKRASNERVEQLGAHYL